MALHRVIENVNQTHLLASGTRCSTTKKTILQFVASTLLAIPTPRFKILPVAAVATVIGSQISDFVFREKKF